MENTVAISIASSKKKQKKYTSAQWNLFFLSIPFLALTFVFYYIPLYGWIYAFYDYKPGISLAESRFVGLQYFKIIFHENSQLVNALKNTFALSFLSIAVSPLPILFAVFLSELKGKFFRKLIQTTTTLPNFISWILVYSVFFMFFSTEGVLNDFLHKLGLPNQSLLVDSDAAWVFQTVVLIWKTLGWGAIIYLAAIAGIDQELYQAAEVDGAGRFRKIWNITIPGLMPTYIVLLLLAISQILSSGGGFEQYFVFFNPLVAEKLEVLDYYVYRVGLTQNSISYATSLGIFKSLISITLLFFVNWISKLIRGESIF